MPSPRTSGSRIQGVSRKIATPSSRAASITSSTACSESFLSLVIPMAILTSTAPPIPTSTPAIIPIMLGFFTAWAVVSPIALMGEMRRAVRAGASEANTVTMVHSATPATNAMGSYVIRILLNNSDSRPATAYTANAPIAENTIPTTRASTISMSTSDEPRAPRVRSKASSRTRCPISTANVLEMTKDETSRASAAKAPRIVPINANPAEIWSCIFFRYSFPVVTFGSVFLSPVLSLFCSSVRAAAWSSPLNLTNAMVAPGYMYSGAPAGLFLRALVAASP